MKLNTNRCVPYILVAFALTLILPQVLVVSSSTIDVANASLNSTASFSTIVVPVDYPTISAAIGNATQGASIIVKKGTYYENPIINKTLSIVGENPDNTVVLGSGYVDRGARAVFTVAAENVMISGLTIKSLNYSRATLYASGIIVNGNHCTITENNIVGTYFGVFCSTQSYTKISRNNITGALKDGIRFCGGSLNTISENSIVESLSSSIVIDGYSNEVLRNNIMNNGRGIGIGSSYSLIYGNSIVGNVESGFYFMASHCIISANEIANNKWGIYFPSFFANPNNNTFYNNNFMGNVNDVNVGSTYFVESWDNGYPSGGNYWNSHNGTDVKTGRDQNAPGQDGIGDTSYTLCSNNIDSYPLMEPFDIAEVACPGNPI